LPHKGRPSGGLCFYKKSNSCEKSNSCYIHFAINMASLHARPSNIGYTKNSHNISTRRSVCHTLDPDATALFKKSYQLTKLSLAANPLNKTANTSITTPRIYILIMVFIFLLKNSIFKKTKVCRLQGSSPSISWLYG